MLLTDLSFLNEPYYMVVVPEYKDQNNVNLHVFRYDVPGKGWKSLLLKYSTGAVPIKEAKDTSYAVIPHNDPNASFKAQQSVELKVEKNIFQLKDIEIKNNLRDSIISDFNKMIQTNFNIQTYTIEEFEELLKEESEKESSLQQLAQRTYKAFQDIGEPLYKQHIARYYLLFTRGGVYLDSKSILKRSLEDKYFQLDKYDGFISMYDNDNGIPEIGFISCKKGSGLLGDVLNKALSNVENRFYGTSSQEPTGNLCFRDFLIKAERTAKTLTYNGETFHVLRQEAGRLYDETNRMVWNRDVYTNIVEKRLDGRNNNNNLWLQCKLYPDGNCYSLSNWKFYASESSQTQAAFAVFAVLAFIVLLFFVYYKTM